MFVMTHALFDTGIPIDTSISNEFFVWKGNPCIGLVMTSAYIDIGIPIDTINDLGTYGQN
jgi:hypothetical protein